MALRPYQSALVGRIGTALSAHRSVLLQLPTGGGKTHIAAHVAGLAAAAGERVWIIAHRREIVGQTSAAMAALGVAHGVVAPGRSFDPGRPVQVCSIASLARRAERLPPPDLLLFDEAHHVASSSWAALRARFPAARHLGLTATPARLDGKGLDEHFAALICGPSTAELMEAGHLSRYRLFAPTIPDLRGVGTRAGDYAKDQLAERMASATLVGDVVEHYRRLAAGCRAVAFAVSVEASRAVVARFNAAGIPAAHIDGATPYAARDAAIADMESGRLRVLSNVEVFTEGFDLPAIDAVILLRPTRSLALYRQMVGRALRAAPGKPPTIILDHAGLVYEHDLPDEPVEWTLQGVRRRPGASGVARLRRCPDCAAVHPWAMACTECGRAYEAGDRTVEEVYGELREIRFGRMTVAPEGYETASSFARRIGSNPTTVKNMLKRGLPRSSNGMIPIAAAIDWVDKYGKAAPHLPPPEKQLGSCETQRAFAVRAGISTSSIRRFANFGLPLSSNGWVTIEPALKWLAARRQRIGDTKAEFANRVGATIAQVSGAREKGLPLEADGSISAEAALLWWKRRQPPRFNGPTPDGYETVTAFCRRIGYSMGGTVDLKKRGLPLAQNGLVHIATALSWIERHGVRGRGKKRS